MNASTLVSTHPSRLILLVHLLLAQAWTVPAATPLVGDVSGTWTVAGSPYVIVLNSRIPAGSSVTIEPGVTVILGTDVRLDVEGGLTAIGTVESPIIFRGTTPTDYWDSILVLSGESSTNRYVLKHCRFSEAKLTAVQFITRGVNRAEFLNCNFSNCLGDGIFGAAEERSAGTTLDIAVKNCLFESLRNGCIFATYGPGVRLAPLVTGCIFRNLRGAACSAVNVNVNALATLQFINNSVFRAQTGVLTEDPNDTVIENNLFLETTWAIRRIGTRGLGVGNNCFFGNTTNFLGYPGVYGAVITVNRNGDPSDVFSNIFLDPAVEAGSDLHLGANSPCIDAGSPAIADACLDLSQGTLVSDIGAYGGPSGCGWRETVFPPIPMAIQAYPGLSITGAIGQTYSIEFREALDAGGAWKPLATHVMTHTTWLFVDTNAPLHVRRFYRVRASF